MATKIKYTNKQGEEKVQSGYLLDLQLLKAFKVKCAQADETPSQVMTKLIQAYLLTTLS